jgi:hypothetical protein
VPVRYFSICLLAVSLLGAGGCGEAGGPSLSGSVTYNGEPVEDGFVTFSPTGSGTSFAAKVTGGKYAPEKVYPGEFKVLVQGTRAVVVPKTREEAEQLAKANAGKPPQSPDYISVNAEGNGQTVEVKEGDQTLDFAITGPPK